MWLRICPGCSREFQTTRGDKIRCRPKCGIVRVQSSASKNGARAKYREEYVPHFVGVDGEGVTHADGSHSYVLLSVGERSLHRDGAHLTFDEIMSFLWECFCDDPDAVYVGYYLGYDFCQWLRSLPESRAKILFEPERRKRTQSGGNPTPFPVYKDGWEFDMLGNKRFKLRREGSKSWMNICDVGGFFQQAFATAILGWQDRQGRPIEIASPEELAIIERGKAARATAKFDPAMITYNVTENRVLSRMMEIMCVGLKDMGVRLQKDQWYGPGQVAQKWMDQHSTHAAKILRAKMDTDEIFRDVMSAAKGAYYGGWFETFAHGHIRGRSYEYDIASAYPHVHSNLPCLLHGNWRRIEGGEGEFYSGPGRGGNAASDALMLVRASVEGSNPYIGSMMHRDRKGKINRPGYTEGWFWKHELDAAQRAGLVLDLQVLDAYAYRPCSCAPPMRDLRLLFKQRLEVGKSTPQGRGLKLTYNSCYGKTAQSIGTPKHANAIHASLITAGCRTMILDAIATHPKGAAGVLMIATDGIYFDSPHPGLQAQQTGELGSWEETVKENLSIFLPGIYWDDKSRESRKAKAAKLKSRGINGADLIARLDALDSEFDRMLDGVEWGMFEGHAKAEWWAQLELPIRFSMVSPKQALQRGKWETAGAVSQSGTKNILSHPRHKRAGMFDQARVSEPTKERPYLHTYAPANHKREASTPYSRNFGMELMEKQDNDFILTPEGDAMDDAYQIIKGE